MQTEMIRQMYNAVKVPFMVYHTTILSHGEVKEAVMRPSVLGNEMNVKIADVDKENSDRVPTVSEQIELENADWTFQRSVLLTELNKKLSELKREVSNYEFWIEKIMEDRAR